MHRNKFFFSTFSCCSKSRDQPQEDIANPDYRTNREIKKSRNPRTCWGTTKICPNPPKISTISKKNSSKCGNCFGNCPKSSLDHVALWQKQKSKMAREMFHLTFNKVKHFPWLKQKSKMAALVTSLYHHLVIIPSSLYPHVNKECYVALPFIQYKQWILYDKYIIAKGKIKNKNILMYIIMLL